MNLDSIKHLLTLAKKTDRPWIVPALLFLIILALVGVAAVLAPAPIFIYPMI